MITFLAIFGWINAALLGLALYSCWKNKAAWRKRYQETEDELHVLEHKNLVADMDKESLKWYRDEVTRLTLKCDAICYQARRMKGRGRVTCETHPRHNF